MSGRVVHDADAHIMETPNWLRDYADPGVRDQIPPLSLSSGNELRQTGDPEEQLRDLEAAFDRLRAKHGSDEYRAVEAEEIMSRKNFAATGAFIPEDRSRALDLLGFSSQLVFNTFHNRRLHDWEHTRQPRARDRHRPRAQPRHGRVLRRRRPAAADLLRPAGRLRRARSRWPTRRSRWARPRCSSRRAARRATRRATSGSTRSGPARRRREIPIVFHVGGTGDLIDASYFRNGLPIPPDFHGGEENFRSVDYMGIPGPPAQTLATMIFDGVLERFPDLRIGVIEQGAIWVPSWMRQMESAFEAFVKHEERLRALSMRPSDYVRRQVRFTPYPTEDVGWIIEQAGSRGLPLLVGLPPRRGRPPPGRALRGVARRRRRRDPATLLLRQLPRPHGLRRHGPRAVAGTSIRQPIG